MMLHKAALIIIISLTAFNSFADNFDILFGAYDLSAKTDTASGSSSNIGAYKLTYSHNLAPQFTLTAGYTLIMSKTVGGDLSFGFDLGGNYYFLTPSDRLVSETKNATMTISNKLRPYVGLTFHQRQFQSVKSNYAGFGLNVGSTFDVNKDYELKALFRYITLSGPQNATATELSLMFGITILITD